MINQILEEKANKTITKNITDSKIAYKLGYYQAVSDLTKHLIDEKKDIAEFLKQFINSES